MSTRSLFDAVIEPGFRNPNFFEGRLLTAGDLRDDQKAHRERQRLLGRALGTGVVEGLGVTLEPTITDGVKKTITIAAGYAINGEGELLWLKNDITAAVVPQTVVPEPPAALFARCEDTATPTPTIPVGVGLYVLVMSPASGYRERAAKSGLGSEGKIIGCGDRYAVDGVRFRLEPLPPALISGASSAQQVELVALLNATSDGSKRSLLRNLIAHLCFGTPQLTQFPVDPFARADGASAYLAYGALDDLRTLGRLTDCDVPLALLLWDTSGIAFLDLWAVRRRPVPPPRSQDWPLLVGERVLAGGEARLLQFQAQLRDLTAEAVNRAGWRVESYFRFLPAAGVITSGGPGGLAPADFFANCVTRFPRPPEHLINAGPVFADGARLAHLLADSLTYPAIDLSADAAASGGVSRRLIWLYRIQENQRDIDSTLLDPERACYVFAHGQMPFVGTPRFDVARWDYANYTSRLTGPGGL
jgi:hypothetical protein